jgi:hypothetical protein
MDPRNLRGGRIMATDGDKTLLDNLNNRIGNEAVNVGRIHSNPNTDNLAVMIRGWYRKRDLREWMLC